MTQAINSFNQTHDRNCDPWQAWKELSEKPLFLWLHRTPAGANLYIWYLKWLMSCPVLSWTFWYLLLTSRGLSWGHLACSHSWTGHTKSPSFAHKSARESANTSETKSGQRFRKSLCPTQNNDTRMKIMLLTSHLGYKTVIPWSNFSL